MTRDSGQPQSFSTPPAGERAHVADALEALARGQDRPETTCPGCGQTNPPAAAQCSSCGRALPPAEDAASEHGIDPFAKIAEPGDAEEELLLTPISDAPAGLTGDLAEMAGATGPASGRRPIKYQAKPVMAPFWRYAIPPMAAMAVLMFAITAWAIAVLAGVDLFVDDPTDRTTRLMAMGMLLTLPVGLFLVFGCYVILRDLKNQANRPGLRPPSRQSG